MFARAHTNQVGYFEKWEPRNLLIKGIANDIRVDVTDPSWCKVGTSYKSPTIKSDHKFPTQYYRQIRECVSDIPFVQRQYEGEPPARITRLLFSQYLSRTMNPLDWTNPEVFTYWMGDVQAKAITRALSKLQEGKVQYGASIAEGKKTANMVASLTMDVFRGYKAFRHAHFGAWVKGFVQDRKIAERYLEFVYGIQPTLGDIHSGCEILLNGIAGNGYTYDVTASPKVSWKQEYPLFDGAHDALWDGIGGCRVSYTVRVKDGGVYTASQLGLTNPLEIAWEIVPFSFLVDWFVPVGQVLSALTASAGLDLVSGYLTSWDHTSWTITRKNPDMYRTLVSGGQIKVNRVRHQREPIFNFMLPQLYDKPNPFTTKHILNAIALIGASV